MVCQRVTLTMRPVLEKLGPTIDKAVYKFAGPDAPPTVYDRARILAAGAVKSYQEQGGSLSAHVYTNLQALQRLAPQIVDPLPMSEKLRRDRAQVYSQIENLHNEYGREPSDEEVASVTGLPLKRVIKVRGLMRAGVPLSSFFLVS